MLGHSALPRLNPSEHRWPCFYSLCIANHPPYWKKLTGRAAAHGYPSSGSRLCLHTILCDVQRLHSDGGWNSRISTRSPVRSQDRLRPSAQRETADAFRSAWPALSPRGDQYRPADDSWSLARFNAKGVVYGNPKLLLAAEVPQMCCSTFHLLCADT